MNGFERCSAALKWERPDRVPVIPQNSVMAIHLAGYDMIEASRNANKLAAALMSSQQRFGYDGIMLGPDAAILAEAIGCETVFRADEPPAVVGPAIKDLSEVGKLRIPDMQRDGRMRIWLEATRMIRDKLGKTVFLACRADQCAFSLAALVYGMDNLAIAIAEGDKVDEIQALLRFCAECHIAFAKAIRDVGADMTTCGDSYGGPALIGPDNYRKFALPWERTAASTIQGVYEIPYSIHICGDTKGIHADWPLTGATCCEVDHKTDIVSLRNATLGKMAILGNLDTGLLCSGSPKDIERSCRDLFEIMGEASGFILSSGCSMSSNSSPLLLEAMVESARRFGIYDQK